MYPLYIIGTAGHAKEMALLVEENNNDSSSWFFSIQGFVSPIEVSGDDSSLRGYKVLEEEKLLKKLSILKQQFSFVIGVGDPKIREKISKTYPSFCNFPAIIHPSVGDIPFSNRWVTNLDILSSKGLADGVIITKGVNITADIKLGKHVHLNTGCTVCHDVKIGDYSIVSPNATVCGNVTIGKRCYIGAGAVIKDGITITDDTIIGAGAVVVKDIIESGKTFIGVPAKELRKNG